MGKTILVVEDNELNLRLFCDLLNAHGYSAHPVRDGRDALARAREVSPDLIIMDIQLPHVSGLELIGQMKADLTLRSVPIMAVTAYAGKGDEEQIKAAGAEAYVSPSWYPSKHEAHRQVPTWNYELVHVRGTAHVHELEQRNEDSFHLAVAAPERALPPQIPVDERFECNIGTESVHDSLLVPSAASDGSGSPTSRSASVCNLR